MTDKALASCIKELILGGPAVEYRFYDTWLGGRTLVYPAVWKDRITTYHPTTPNLAIKALRNMKCLRLLKLVGAFFWASQEHLFVETIKISKLPLESFILEGRNEPDNSSLILPGRNFGIEMIPLKSFGWSMGRRHRTRRIGFSKNGSFYSVRRQQAIEPSHSRRGFGGYMANSGYLSTHTRATITPTLHPITDNSQTIMRVSLPESDRTQCRTK